jgi:outer membrane protein
MKIVFCLTWLLCVIVSVHAEDVPVHLTLRQAEQIALAQHPRISVANLTALAARQATEQARAAFFPNVYGSLTAAGTLDPNNTRIAAGQLSNPHVYDRQADGLTISQLITDFGRTSELTRSAKLRSRAQQMNLAATQEQILLEVNNAYFSSLSAQSVVQVAEETVKSRRLVEQQTTMLATNKLKSGLDVSFANVDLDQASIMMVKARSDLKASFAVLSTLLADRKPETFILAEEPMPPNITNDVSALILVALAQRPDLARLRYQRDAAKEFARAQGKLLYPTISAIAEGGIVPAGGSTFTSPYGAAGVNVNIPLFTGGLYTSQHREAEYEAKAADEDLRAEEDDIIRDVQETKLNFEYSYDRLALTQQLLENANQALELARARFKNGLSSIIELTQAELNQTSAQISQSSARYEYQIQHAALEFQLGHLR